MNEGLSNNWLFTSILLPQRPGLSCRDSNKQCRQAAARGGAVGEGTSEWVCALDWKTLSLFQDLSDRSAGSSDWTVYISGPCRLYGLAPNAAISQAVKRWTELHPQLMVITGQTSAQTQSGWNTVYSRLTVLFNDYRSCLVNYVTISLNEV